MMERITWDVFGHRIGGGLVGFLISSLWCCCRMNYRHAIQQAVPTENEHHASENENQEAERLLSSNRIKMQSIRLHMHGGSYI